MNRTFIKSCNIAGAFTTLASQLQVIDFDGGKVLYARNYLYYELVFLDLKFLTGIKILYYSTLYALYE